MEKIFTKIEKYLYFVIIACFFFFPVRYLVQFTLFPNLLEYREAASLYTAFDFSNGINPYAVSMFPQHIYLYGPLYPLLLSLFIKLIQPAVLIARVVNVVSLFLIGWLIYRFFGLYSVSRRWRWLGNLIIVNGFCLVLQVNATRPDLLGEFFMLASLYVVIRYRASYLSLILSILSATIALYLKQYMLFPIVIIAIYLFLSVSKKKAIIYTAISAVVGLSSFILFSSFLPLFPEYFLVHHINAETYVFSHVVEQTKFFIRCFWIFGLLFLVSLSAYVLPARTNTPKIHVNLRAFDEPFIENRPFDLVDLYILAVVFLLTFSLGGHTGNVYIYYLELLLPPLVVKALHYADLKLRSRPIWQFGLFLSIFVLSLYPFRTTYWTNFDAYGQAYAALVQDVQHCSTIYDTTPLLAGTLLDNGRQSEIYNNGQIQYAESTLVNNQDNPVLRYLWLEQSNTLQQQLTTWNKNIDDRIHKQEFDCIVLQSSRKGASIEGYRLSKELPTILGKWDIELWVPDK